MKEPPGDPPSAASPDSTGSNPARTTASGTGITPTGRGGPTKSRAIWKAILWEIIAILCWSYAITKVFVFDIDRYFLERLAPSLIWLIDFKIFFIVGLILVLVVAGRRAGVVGLLAFVIFYPIILLVWRIPYFVLKQRSWNLALAFVNALATVFGSWKYNIVVASLFILSIGGVVFSRHSTVIATAVVILCGLLIVAYSKRFLSIFRPSQSFRVLERLAGWLPKTRSVICAVEDSMKGVPYENLTRDQAEKWKANLQGSIILSRLCLFVARKLRDYGRSRLTKVASVFISLLMVVETVVAFTFINYGLFRLDSTMFHVTSPNPGIFEFFYYSANRMVFCEVDDIVPYAVLAKSSYLMEGALALFLVAILVSLLFSTRSEALADELNRSIEAITQQGRAMEKELLVEYQFNSMDAALTHLKQLRAGLLEWIYKLSEPMDQG